MYLNVTTYDGKPLLSYSYIEKLRAADAKKRDPYKIIAQKGGQENMLSCTADIIIGGGSRGGSKCVPLSTPVCTPFGFRPISELKKGSIITGRDGRMQRVQYISFNGVKDVYRLTFIDGSSCVCSHDHAWTLRKTNYISKRRRLNGLGVEADWRVWTTEMINEHLKFEKAKKSKCSANLIIPLCDPVAFTRSFPKKNKSIDPYIIGALIGDGCFSENIYSGKAVSLTTTDKEIVKEFESSGIFMGLIQHKSDTEAKGYIIKEDWLVDYIESLGLNNKLSADKFIPDCYLYGTIDERFAIVQGLMDTDGAIDQRGHCSYSTISEQLAKDVKFLINSLGGTATINKNKAGYKKDGEYIRCSDVYNVYIKMPKSERLFRLSRKKDLSKPYNGGVSEYGRRIVDCEYMGKEEVCCIRVENPDSLYLIDDFIVTHNSFSLLLETLNDVHDKNFKGVLFRNEVDDLTDLIDVSNSIYSDFGVYNRSKGDMTWNFQSGGFLKFQYYSDPMEDFKKRMQGKQYAYIGIDEITQIEYPKFKYLITNNRNAFGIRNRFWGTCNPDPDSWVAKFIEWWIDDDGFPIPERNGRIRYCFMDGDDVDDIYWGDTREEVYLQCREIIDRYWLDSYSVYGKPEDLFVKSVAFVEARLADNIQLMRSDPTYLANLAGQSEEQRSRDLEGNWKFKTAGDDMIKIPHMEAFYSNPEQTGDGVRRATLDAAFDGGDNLVMWLWVGWHLKDLFVCRKDSKDTVDAVKSKLKEWGVLEENFTYDLNGIGQVFKGYFKSAVPFNNRESVAQEDKGLYDTIKSQSAYLFAKKIINKEISIEPYLLTLRFKEGKNEGVPLSKILMSERKAIKANSQLSDKGFSIIRKADMKRIVGHSPDFIEALLMRMIFEIKKKKNGSPKWRSKYVQPNFYAR